MCVCVCERERERERERDVFSEELLSFMKIPISNKELTRMFFPIQDMGTQNALKK